MTFNYAGRWERSITGTVDSVVADVTEVRLHGGWLQMLRLFVVVGTVPKFGSALFRNAGDTARLYTGPNLQKRTPLASDVLTNMELFLPLHCLDLLVTSRFSFICVEIAKLKNRISILFAHGIRLYTAKQLLTFQNGWR